MCILTWYGVGSTGGTGSYGMSWSPDGAYQTACHFEENTCYVMGVMHVMLCIRYMLCYGCDACHVVCAIHVMGVMHVMLWV